MCFAVQAPCTVQWYNSVIKVSNLWTLSEDSDRECHSEFVISEWSWIETMTYSLEVESVSSPGGLVFINGLCDWRYYICFPWRWHWFHCQGVCQCSTVFDPIWWHTLGAWEGKLSGKLHMMQSKVNQLSWVHERQFYRRHKLLAPLGALGGLEF